VLKYGDRIQYAFRYIDKDNDNKEIMEWSTGTVLEVSNGSNLYQGCRAYCKDGAVEVQWNANEENNKETSTSIIEIKTSVFNSYVEHSWCMLLNVE
jgi:hypothetical protein